MDSRQKFGLFTVDLESLLHEVGKEQGLFFLQLKSWGQPAQRKKLFLFCLIYSQVKTNLQSS